MYLLETALVSAMVLRKSETLSSLTGETNNNLHSEKSPRFRTVDHLFNQRLPRISTPEFVITWFRSAWATRPRSFNGAKAVSHFRALPRKFTFEFTAPRGLFVHVFIVINATINAIADCWWFSAEIEARGINAMFSHLTGLS